MKSQTGFSLLISIFILGVISAGALMSMQRTTLQERILINLRQQQDTFDASQSSLNDFLKLLANTSENLIIFHQIIQDGSKDISDLSHYNRNGFSSTLNAEFLDQDSDQYNLKSMNGFSYPHFIYYHFSVRSETQHQSSTHSTNLEIGIRFLAQRP